MPSTAVTKNDILKIIKKWSRKLQEIQELRTRTSKIIIVTENISSKVIQFNYVMNLFQHVNMHVNALHRIATEFRRKIKNQSVIYLFDLSGDSDW